MKDRVILKVSEGEDIFFKKQEQKQIKALRKKTSFQFRWLGANSADPEWGMNCMPEKDTR